MSETVNGTSGTDQKPSGLKEELSDGESSSTSKDTVAYDTYRKVLAEKKKRDEDFRAAQEELSALKRAEKERTEAELKAKEDFKKLVELREKELNEVKSKYDGLNSSIQESVKFSAFLENLPGQLDKKFWKMVDTSEVIIDPESGEPDPTSIKKATEKFVAQYGELVQTPGKAKLPNQAATTATAINDEVWKSMSPKDKKENLHRYVEWRKTK